MLNNDEIKAMLSNVKIESNIYFDKMDNSFINEIANKIRAGDNKWKYFSKFVTKKEVADNDFGIKQFKDKLLSPESEPQ